MTSVFDAAGKNVPCTVIEVGPCCVTQIKSVEKDGYAAVQVGFEEAKEKNTSAPLMGHFKKAGVTPKRHLAEFKDFEGDHKAGDTITVELFNDTQFVDVIGTSKGKGFAGSIKRHNFARGPMGHGSKSHREPGSTGAMLSGPGGRVIKGKRLPGRMGGTRTTIQRLTIVKVDADRNLLLIKGAIPGPKKGLVIVRETVKPTRKHK